MTSGLPADALLDLPGNPVPPGAVVRVVRTADGVTLRTAAWPAPSGPVRGTVLLLQGRAEFIEKYFEVVSDLTGRGFAVATFDWRGQGGSARALADGRKGHVDSFDAFRLDLEAVAAALLPPPAGRPVVVLAHSMGGCVALIGAADGWLRANRLVASTPMIGLSLVRRPGVVRFLADALGRLGLGRRLVPGGVGRSISTLPFRNNRLSTDSARYARNALVAAAAGDGAIGSPTIAWLQAAYRAMARFAEPGFGARIAMPVLIVGAGDDPVCSTPDAERLAMSLGGRATFLAIARSRHEVLMETDAIRKAFWAAFDAFVDAPSVVQDAQDLGVEAPVAARDHGAAAGG